MDQLLITVHLDCVNSHLYFKLSMNVSTYIYNTLLYLQVGTGFSYTDKGGLSTTEEEVADNLYSCITQFLTIFSEYRILSNLGAPKK